MQKVKVLNHRAHFLLEAAALVALGYWGFFIGEGIVPKICMAISVPFVVAMGWVAFGEPQSPAAFSLKGRILLALMLFLLAVLGLAMTNHAALAGTLGLTALLNVALLAVWRQG
ncbi:MAG: DUF2568 domain-containing protein [Anaerolineales bacterium]|nr:DUF2568 domain-containing protein [Anaerolineales bacterium]